MKAIYSIILILWSFAANSQQAESQLTVAVRNAIHRIEYLNSLNHTSQRIYTYSLSYVYMPANDEFRQSLGRVIASELPKLKESRNLIEDDNKGTFNVDSALAYTDQLAARANWFVANLATFEDYEDSIKTRESQLKLEMEIVPLYRKKMGALKKLIVGETNSLFAMLGSKTFSIKFNGSLIKSGVEMLLRSNENRQLLWSLTSEAINLVYRKDDSVARNTLREDILRNPQITADDIKARERNLHIEKTFESIKTGIGEISDKLAGPDSYDDGMTKLLCEENLHSQVVAEFLSIEPELNEEINFYKLGLLIYVKSKLKE